MAKRLPAVRVPVMKAKNGSSQVPIGMRGKVTEVRIDRGTYYIQWDNPHPPNVRPLSDFGDVVVEAPDT